MKPSVSRFRRSLPILLLLFVMAAVWISRLDASADSSLDTALSRAFITFATARGLNAAISAVQGTELTFGVGASATLSVGQVLDPVNDLVEQFAELMLVATVSLGVQQVLLSMGQHILVKLVLTAVLIGWGILYLAGRTPPRWLNGLLILALMARFAIPLAAVGNDVVFEHFLAEDYRASESAIGTATRAVEAESPGLPAEPPPDAPADQGWIEDLKDLQEQLMAGLDVSGKMDRVEELKQSVEDTAEHVVDLIVVFLLQTLIVPVAILWLLYLIVRNVLGAG